MQKHAYHMINIEIIKVQKSQGRRVTGNKEFIIKLLVGLHKVVIVCDAGLLVNKLQFPIMVIISNKPGCGSYMVGKF